MLLAVAVFSRENEFVHFSIADGRDNEVVNLQIMAQSSMDAMEERERGPSNRAQEMFHGCLLSNMNYKCFGYITNTQVKFLLIFDAADVSVRDQDVRSYFKRLHVAYCNAVCNPFFQRNCALTSKRFHQFVRSLTLRKSTMPGGVVKIADVSDFISPSQACILPMPDAGKQSETLVGLRTKSDPRPAKTADAAKISVSLKDCLACSGCITTAETVLIEEQNAAEMFEADGHGEGRPRHGRPAAALRRPFDSPASSNTRERTTYSTRPSPASSPLDVLAEEFTRRNLENEKPEVILSTACPGFVCYAEKKKKEVVSKLSAVRSPQGISGAMVKDYLCRAMDWKPEDVYHVALMPCYDKKLEASRPEFVVPGSTVKEVDCVVTPTELQSYLEEAGDLLNTPTASPSVVPFEWLTAFERGLVIPDLPDEGSGGYTEHLDSQRKSKREATVDLEYITLQPPTGRSLMLMKAYGFRNIQNLMRKLRLKKLAPDFVEVMACPRGCLNGGGQIRHPDPQQQEAQLEATTRLYTRIDSNEKPDLAAEARRLRSQWAEMSPDYQQFFVAQFHAVPDALPNSVASLQW
ncbi:Trafficking protein particle complex subunit 2-like protein [Aphelenchoides fujianensis]|nr:Trafficking protein particle complex subunit 2-like protein [Aphelenchoides fujianensis]